MQSPEGRNWAAIERLEHLLDEIRSDPSKPRETEAIREIGFEIAIAVREVGALLAKNIVWEQTAAADQRPRHGGSEPAAHD